MFITILFSLLFRAFKTSDLPNTQYLANKVDVPSLAGMGYRLNVMNAVVALGACTPCGRCTPFCKSRRARFAPLRCPPLPLCVTTSTPNISI